LRVVVARHDLQGLFRTAKAAGQNVVRKHASSKM
jgi:hypothetical protein